VPRTKSPPAVPTKSRSDVQSEEAARQFAWIDWLQGRTGQTDSSLAEEAGLQKNYLYRKRADGTVLGASQIRMLMERWEAPGPDTYLLPGASGLADEGAPYDQATGDPLLRATIELLLKGRNNAAPWRLKTLALESAGYLPGDIVISDNAVHPRAGDAVVAQVYDVRTGTAETVFRLFEPPYLIAASSEPALRKPLLVDNERVIVMGPITQSFRARRA
jgi:hypothetical protein